jgi:hypothetical protein
VDTWFPTPWKLSTKRYERDLTVAKSLEVVGYLVQRQKGVGSRL